MNKEIEKRIGCPIEKLPIGVTATIAADSHGHKGTFEVLRVVIMEDHTYPYIEFLFKNRSGKTGKSECFLKDYGLTWAASEEDWPDAIEWYERKQQGAKNDTTREDENSRL